MKRTGFALAAVAIFGLAACETDQRDDIDRVEVTPAPAPAPAPAPMPMDTFPMDTFPMNDTMPADSPAVGTQPRM